MYVEFFTVFDNILNMYEVNYYKNGTLGKNKRQIKKKWFTDELNSPAWQSTKNKCN